jgi:hypothetical protein
VGKAVAAIPPTTVFFRWCGFDEEDKISADGRTAAPSKIEMSFEGDKASAHSRHV